MFRQFINQMQQPFNASALLNGCMVIMYLLSMGFLVRFPTCFEANVGWDEGTYILSGQAMIDCPDPDLARISFRAYPYALFILLFGKSIFWMRFAGTVCIALSSLFVYLIGNRLWNHCTGLVAATLSTLMMILVPSGGQGQATLSEPIALVPLLGAFCVLAFGPLMPLRCFITGIFVAMACLVRLNLAYVAVPIGVFILVSTPRESVRRQFWRAFAYAAGGVSILSISYMDYVTNGLAHNWWRNFSSGMSYASNQMQMSETIIFYCRFLLASLLKSSFGISVMLWVGGAAGIVLILRFWKDHNDSDRRVFILLLLFLAATGFSIAAGGAAYGHYTIQVVPFMALAAGSAFSFSVKRIPRIVIAGVVIACTMSLLPSAAKVMLSLKNIKETQAVVRGPAYEIASFLRQANPNKEPMYLLDEHIAYWFCDSLPMSRSTFHPSNIGKPYLLEPGATTESEMRKILDKRPLFIVKKKNVKYLQRWPDANQLLEDAIANHYQLVAEFDSNGVFRQH